MTDSPADLVEIQHYVQSQTGLPWASLGIKHATPDGGGYHEGNDLLSAAGRLTTDYSKRESSRDRPGTNSASAFDLGGAFGRFREITMGIVHACQGGDPRARDIREVIYTPDGQTVRRWDRLGIRSSGDSSHLSHTHTSFFRDSEGRRNRADNFLGLLRELFEGIADMEEFERKAGNADVQANALLNDYDTVTIKLANGADFTVQNKAKVNRAAAFADVKTAAGQSAVTMSQADRDAIVAALLNSVPSAAQIAEELAKRLGNG